MRLIDRIMVLFLSLFIVLDPGFLADPLPLSSRLRLVPPVRCRVSERTDGVVKYEK